MANYAVVVGIEDYPKHQSLEGAVNDARKIFNWLVSPEGGNVPKANCRVIKSRRYRLANRAERSPGPLKPIIDQAFQDLLTNAFESGGADRFYFYFSGHGVGLTPMNNALCMADWSMIAHNSSISSEGYLNVVQQSNLFDEIVFLLDCCRDSIQFNFKGEDPNFGMPEPPVPKNLRAKFIAFASQFGNASFEANQGLTQKSLVSGLFTQALIEGLQQKKAVDPQSGRITGASLASYLKERTPILALARNRNQNAEIMGNLGVNLFFGVPQEATRIALEITFSLDLQADVELQDQTLRTIQTHNTANGPLQISLKPGFYRIRLSNSPEFEKLFIVDPQNTHLNVNF